MREAQPDIYDLQTIRETVALAMGVHKLGESGEPFQVLPEGLAAFSVEEYLPEPMRIRRHLVVRDADSFKAYFDKWAHDKAELYADETRAKVRAIFDEHEVDSTGDPIPREWKAWSKSDKQKMDQVAFAEFLEDRMIEITSMDGTALMDLVTKFQVIRTAAFGSVKHLSTGEFSIAYSEENQNGSVEMPDRITIGVPVFERGDKWEVEARLRYRVYQGELSLWYEMIEPWRVVEEAFKGVVADIEEGTSRTATHVDLRTLDYAR